MKAFVVDVLAGLGGDDRTARFDNETAAHRAYARACLTYPRRTIRLMEVEPLGHMAIRQISERKHSSARDPLF